MFLPPAALFRAMGPAASAVGARSLFLDSPRNRGKNRPKAFPPWEPPDARESLSIIQHSTESLGCGLRATGSLYARQPLRGGSPRTESLTAAFSVQPVSFPRSGMPTKARRKKVLVGLARNGVETVPQPLTKSSGDLAFSFERSMAQRVTSRGRDSKGQGPLVTLAYFW